MISLLTKKSPCVKDVVTVVTVSFMKKTLSLYLNVSIEKISVLGEFT